MSGTEASGIPSMPGRERSTILAGGLLAVLVVLAFWPVVSGARSFFHLDLRYEHLPVWFVTQKALLTGASPFWIEGEYCGDPLLFIQESPLFYPLTVPLLMTGAPVHRIADLFSLFHYWLAGYAVFLLVRDQTRNATAAMFGGVAWMLSARLVQSAIWPNAVAVSALLPFLLLGLLRVGRGQRRSGVLCLTIAGGLALLAARPHVLLASAPVLCAVTLGVVLRAKSRIRVIRDLALAGALALALGAPSWLPSAALYPEMSRSGGLSRAERDLHPLTLGKDLADVFLPVDGAPRWPEAAAYPGVVVLLLFVAGVALLRRRSDFPRVLFVTLAAGGLVGLVFAFGESGPYRWLADLPLVRGFRVPARYLISWSFALAFGSALTLAHFSRRRGARRGLSAVGLVLLSVDLVAHARRAAPTAPSAVQTEVPDLARGLSERLGRDETGFPRRFISAAEPLNPILYRDPSMIFVTRHLEPLNRALGMRFGLESIDGAGPTLRRTEELLGSGSPRPYQLGGVAEVVVNAPRPPGMPKDFPLSLRVEKFEGLPRVILVPEARVVPAAAVLSSTLDPTLDPRQTVILESGAALAREHGWDGEGVRRSIRLVSRAPARIVLDVSLPARGVLVIFNAFASGWTAHVDDAAAPVLRADAAFQAVRLSAGSHRVVLAYHPRGLFEGLGLCAAGVLGTFLAARRLPRIDAVSAGPAL